MLQHNKHKTRMVSRRKGHKNHGVRQYRGHKNAKYGLGGLQNVSQEMANKSGGIPFLTSADQIMHYRSR